MRENTDFVISIVRKFVRNPEIAKDLTQEIFIKAYLNYDYYTETGKIKSWLSVIANNKLKNYYKTEKCRSEQVLFLPLEDFMTSNEEESPDNITEQKDFTEQIVKIINTLPQRQRDAVFYSVIYQYSEKEIAAMQNIPVGSVKSAKHYGLEKVKKIILETNLINNNYNNDLIGKVKNNMSKLTKQEAYELLYQYAKNHISSENKEAVEEYIKTDEECANIAEALRELHSKLACSKDDENRHYNICFGLKSGDNVVYSNMATQTNEETCRKCNEYLDAHDGNTPPEEEWFTFGFGGDMFNVQYDNNGNNVEYEVYYIDESNHKKVRAKKMKKVYYPIHWQCSVYYSTQSAYKKLDIAPNLYQAKYVNYFGNDVKSGLYLALPENAVNIRMKHGIGILEYGKYKIIYDDRYVAEDEGVWTECTFNLSE